MRPRSAANASAARRASGSAALDVVGYQSSVANPFGYPASPSALFAADWSSFANSVIVSS